MTTAQLPLSSVVFDESVYPRRKHDPTLVQRYAECMEAIEAAGNFISLSGDNRLIDGRHRHLAYQTIYRDDPDHVIPVQVYDITDNEQVFDLAAELNSQAGWQMTEDDKRTAAVRMYSRGDGRKTQEQIAKSLSIAKSKVSGWLSAIIDNERQEREARMLDMYLACHTQEQIGEAVGIARTAVTEFLQKMSAQFCGNDPDNFRNFTPELYTIWNFGKATNEVRHFGNIPPEIIDNLPSPLRIAR